jgi:hypothetical protein
MIFVQIVASFGPLMEVAVPAAWLTRIAIAIVITMPIASLAAFPSFAMVMSGRIEPSGRRSHERAALRGAQLCAMRCPPPRAEDCRHD